MSKHTPGPWKQGKSNPNNVSAGDALVCRTFPRGKWSDEDEANARLIAEAGTVATETGLTPRQLAAQRVELLAILGEMVTTFYDAGCHICGGDCSSANPPVMGCPNEVLRRARAVIVKTEGEHDE